ncbi:MAG: hypothetical protein WCT85_03390 [Parachlamydiales bacterium]|jgi:hypothetical protein
MSITCNTYGIRSINAESFNTYGSQDAHLPHSIRDFAVTSLKINNLILNILGYIPGVAQISGCIRMGIGSSIIILSFALGSPNAKEGLIIGRWFKEALVTGTAQIARGALEAFFSFGRLINLSLDVIGTIINLHTEVCHLRYTGGMEEDEILAEEARPPYRDPNYPILFIPLYFA